MSTKGKADRIVEPKIEKFMRGLMLEATGRIMKKTPVDTGRARGNWNASVNKPDLSVDNEYENGTPKGLVDSAKLNEAQREIQRVEFTEGQVGYIANGLPYIMALENGSSEQARRPDGMVRVTVEELREWARRAAQRIGRG